MTSLQAQRFKEAKLDLLKYLHQMNDYAIYYAIPNLNAGVGLLVEEHAFGDICWYSENVSKK